MKDVRVVRVTYTNFKGLRSLSVEPLGQDLDVFAGNGVGKTSIVDGILWCWFGKDSAGNTDFAIKTLNPDGSVIPMIDHTVEVEVLVNGMTRIFTRTYREKWEQKRGSAEKTFSGHETVYAVDGVSKTMGEYRSLVAELCDEKVFRSLCDPNYMVSELPWQDRRKLLLAICGDITDEDVIKSDPSLKGLPKILQGRSVDDHIKVCKASMTKLNDVLKTTPHRIDEANRSKIEVPAGDHVAEVRLRQARLDSLLASRAQAASGGNIAELEVAIKVLEGKRLGRINTLRLEFDALQAATNKGCEANRQEVLKLNLELDERLHEGSICLLNRERAVQERAEAKTQLNDFRASEFVPTGTTCFACGQPIPEDKIEAQRSAFNESKARQIEETIAKGKSANALVSKYATDLFAIESEVERIKNCLDDPKYSVGNLHAPRFHYESEPTYQQIVSDIADIQLKLDGEKQGNGTILAQLDSDIERAKSLLREAQSFVDAQSTNQAVEARIAELQQLQKTTGSEYTKLEGEVALCEKFIRAKIDSLTDRINSKFQLIRWKLFETQVNEGIRQCCEATINGVPYEGGLNHGSKINAGLDCINALAAYYDVAAPIFVDGAESVTRLLPTKGQKVRLCVSADDSKFRFVRREQAPTNALF